MVSSPLISRGKSVAIAAVVALVAALGLVGSTASAASADNTASLSGTVTSATTGLPIANVQVGLDLPGGNYVQFGSTDANGNYTFTGLAAASYVVNFAAEYDDNYVQQWWNNKPTLATATPISVASGQQLTGINASLVDGATVTGNVQTASGPDSFAHVDVEDAAGNIYGSTMTDNNGNYSVTQIPAGSFTMAFTESFNSTGPSLWWNEEPSLATADYFTTTAGQTTSDIDATFTTGPSGSVSGVVYGPGTPGAPIAEGSVQAFTPDGTFAANAFTASDGSYTISGLAPGSYTLEFAPGFLDSTLAPEYWQDEPTQASADYFTISDGDALTGYDAHLAVGGTITGTVLDGANGNAPLAGVYVNLEQNGINANGFGFTDDQGNYTMTGLAPGTYDVVFQAPSTNDATQWWHDSPTEATATHVTVTDGSTVTGINATMHAGASISGVVTGKTPSGAVFPAGNVIVDVYRADGSLVSDYLMTDGDGNYSITNLVSGSYTLYFAPQGDTTDWVPQWWKNKSTEATATVITVKAGQAKTGISPVFASTTLKPVTPRISGTARVGSTLTVKAGTWHPGTVALSYQWLRGGVTVDGATGSTYTLTNADANSAISVTVTGTETGYTTDSVTSAATKPVTGGVLTSSTPTISGATSVGQILTAVPGTWGPGTVNLTYKWYRGTARIGGATSSTYTLVHADAGKTITVKVTGAEAGFTSATVASAPSAVVH